ncbi:hypothetical protein [Streptomyces virginiae]|uniref:hypothetical protein n=1 Tax=Streptomyces virginiae TaxID=1961 RepID=UPI00345D75BA
MALGALCGLAAHLVLAPARHVHHPQQAVADLYSAMSWRLNRFAELLDGEDCDTAQLRQRRDWRGLAADCDRLRTAIHAEMENNRLHPHELEETPFHAVKLASQSDTRTLITEGLSNWFLDQLQ